MTDPDLDRLLELENEKIYHLLETRLSKEYEQLKSKLNEKLEQLDKVRNYLTTNWYLLPDGVRWTLQDILKVTEK